MKQRFVVILFMTLLVCGAGGWVYWTKARSESDASAQQFRKFVEESRSDSSMKGLSYDWLDCLERYWSEEDQAASEVVCETWTVQGVTSSLIALRFGDQRVPVIETHLVGIADNKHIVIDIMGGPGGELFHVDPVMTDKFIERLRGNDMPETLIKDMKKSPYYQLMQRGYTITSIGYWGMSIRTTEASGEIELAVDDVRRAIDYYRDKRGSESPLITYSLGNHLALAALGKDRLEGMDFLALVPVMDGLQHHVKRVVKEHAEKRAEANAKGEPFLEWSKFNVYKQSDDGPKFDHSRMVDMLEFVPNFMGKSDWPWHDVTPRSVCSQIALGAKDPRTSDYLNSKKVLPFFIKVWDADHNLFKDAPEKSKKLFAEFAECLGSKSDAN